MNITTSILVTFTSIAAAQQPIQIRAICQSINLSPEPSRVGALPAIAYFTTYDGRRDRPPIHDSLLGGRARLSGELSPLTRSSSDYITDFVIISTDWDFWGSAGCTMPTTDLDRNGIPDWIEPNHTVNVTVPAGITWDYPSYSTSVSSMQVVRLSGQATGSFIFADSTGGGWNIAMVTGSCTNLGGTLDGPISLQDPLGEVKPSRISLRIARINTSQLSISTGAVFDSTGAQLVSFPAPTILTRFGHEYRGVITLLDGNASTSWPDYRDWYLTLTDPNDSNRNGIPDLTDPPAVRLTLTTKPDGKMTLTITPPEGLPVASKIVFLESPDLRAWTPFYTNNSAALWTYSPDPAQTTKFIRVSIHAP